MNAPLSPHDIAENYFSSSTLHRPTMSRGLRDDSEPQEFSASARYIFREVKKLLAQYTPISGAEKGLSTQNEDDLLELIKGIELREGESLSDRERVSVLSSLRHSMDHYDILTPLIENPEVNDIIIRSFKDISVQSGRRNIQTDLSFGDEENYKSFIERLLKRAGKACTLGTPIVDASPDPKVRVCATHESLSPSGQGPLLTIRVARHESISLEALVHHQLAPKGILDYLGAMVASGRFSLLICGEVGTGKTTLLRALAQKIPHEEAILTIEDTHEIVLDRPFVRSLLTRESNSEGAGRLTSSLAIRTGMRMAMNRLILGEMRDAEAAESFIDVCSSGHAGMSTIHSRSAKDAINRLELFLSRAQGRVQMETIRRQIANAVSIVIYLGLCRETQTRRVLEVAELGAFADGAIQFSPLFRYGNSNGIPSWKREGGFGSLPLPPVGSILRFDDGPESGGRNDLPR